MPALFEFLLRMGDSDLVLGQRLSAWCGHAPALEEDIALANTALDLIGQTRYWLGLAGEIEGYCRTADDLAFRRDVREFRNHLLVERPNGDFGQTLMRQFLFDAWHLPMLQGLSRSSEPRIAAIAGKAAKEAAYHRERSTDLIIRLGDGTAESHERLQRALNALWPYTGEMLRADAIEDELAAAGSIPRIEDIAAQWSAHMDASLAQATLERPPECHMQEGGKRGIHSEHLGYLLAEMQFLPRAYPHARW